jgi:murein DD-endopeptidase MepM/ murein hydrolase activator NlpD
MRTLFILLLLLAAVAGGAWILAGRADGPALEIGGSAQVGQIGDLVVSIETPDAALLRLSVVLRQNGVTTDLFEATSATGILRLSEEPPGEDAGTDPGTLVQDGPDRLRLTRSIGKRALPDLEAGKAEIVVSAVRPVLFGWRQAASVATREIEVQLTPPQISVLSNHHYINQGGSEAVIYRVTPAVSDSGVRVGEIEYPGFPASGAGIANADPGMRIAFFALLPQHPVDAPIRLFARDELGNEALGLFDHRVFPKAFRSSQIHVDDRFLARVVPAILQNSTELKVPDPTNLLEAYLVINRELRRENDATIAGLAAETAPEILWQGPFEQLVNTAVEAGFADQRTYLYKGRAVDEQVHLGFDLASTAHAAVHAANRGRVVFAGWLGIYGNCVIVDHGMGLQSLYAHLSRIDVKKGDLVDKGATLGHSGKTGLAGGDHLHFTMLLDGHPVTPIDWWSKKWVEDRVMRKIEEAGAS